MTKARSKSRHYFPVISAMLLVTAMALFVGAEINLQPAYVTVAAVTYLVANVLYNWVKSDLHISLVIEYGLVAILIQFLGIYYLT